MQIQEAIAGSLADVVAVVALLALLVTAYAHPRPLVEAAVAVVAGLAALTTGRLGLDAVGSTLGHLAPVVVFLAAVLVVAEVCSRAGLFAAAAAVVRRTDRGDPRRLLLGAFVLAAAVTCVLSLDATVVLVTPVVVAAARGAGWSSRPVAWACLRMANSASLLLPVSNLTNLLAMRDLDLTFAGFALAMAPVLVVVLVVEWVALRVLFRRELSPATASGAGAVGGPRAGAVGEAGADEDGGVAAVAPPWERVPLVVVTLMLAGFAVGSPLGVEPGWVAAVAAVVLMGWAARRGLLTWPEAARATHPSFALFVLGLGVVVATLTTGPLGDAVGRLLPAPSGAPSWTDLLVVALVATVLANLVTNLSATLLVVPLVAPLGTDAVLAALLGLNIGSGLTYTGSLANLLWRRGLGHSTAAPSMRTFHAWSLTTTPVVLLAAVTALALT
ncbi:SLC13 family permease [Nocardioides sp. P86]|uniref:SLC13 family permease n=1 Tax=Nocardioides sp. P86 TaxID=2939569 RepID=UPI0020405A60|nr:SLC13 family permease [Nocardioides sp. P86]MCM3514402.1 arsenic transporter [Nocardioides sp. P86]